MACFLAVALVPVSVGSPGGDVPVWHLVPDVTSVPTTYAEQPAPALPASGQRVVFVFSGAERHAHEGIGRVVTSSGDEVMHAFVGVDDNVYVSDGEGDGTPRAPLMVGWAGGTQQTKRLDVILEGSTFTAIYSGPLSLGPVTGRAFHTATVGQGLEGDATIHRIGHYPATAHVEDFAFDAFASGWTSRSPDGAFHLETTEFGHDSMGRSLVEGEGTLDGLTYARANVAAFDGRYIAEAAVLPARVPLVPGSIPDHQAVLAGVSGPEDSPTVDWAVVIAPADHRPDRWSLFHIDNEGHRTQVAPTYTSVLWHNVRIFVDEHDGTLAVQVDDAATVKVFDLLASSSDHVAVGDVWTDDMWRTGGGAAHLDGLAVLPWA